MSRGEEVEERGGRSGSGGRGLCGEQFADNAAEHLAGRHSAPTGRGFQLHRLPPGQEKSQFNDFLIRAGCVE